MPLAFVKLKRLTRQTITLKERRVNKTACALATRGAWPFSERSVTPLFFYLIRLAHTALHYDFVDLRSLSDTIELNSWARLLQLTLSIAAMMY